MLSTSLKIFLSFFLLVNLKAFGVPLTPETTLGAICLEYYKNEYSNAKNTKVFIYARDNKTGNDRCVMHRGEGNTDDLIKAGISSCKKLHSYSECKLIAINENWMVKQGDFTPITQPNLTPITKDEINALMRDSEYLLRGNCISFFKEYLSKESHKVFAYALDEKEHFACSQSSRNVDIEVAKRIVIEDCNNYSKTKGENGPVTPCKVFAENNKIIADKLTYAEALKALNNKPIDIFKLAKRGVPKELDSALKSGIDVNIQDNSDQHLCYVQSVKTVLTM